MDLLCLPEKPHHGSGQNYVQCDVCAEMSIIIIMQNLQQPTIFINSKNFGSFSDSTHTFEVSTSKKWN